MIITSEQIITRAKFRLRLADTTEHDLYLLRLIEEGARGLNASSTFTVQCKTVEIDCASAKLPDSYDSLIAFSFNNNGSCSGCCGAATVDPTPPSDTQIVICSCRGLYGVYTQNNIILQHGTYGWYGNYFSINGNYLVFPSTITATQVTIYYRGFNQDDDGMMILDEELSRGLSAYAAGQFATDFQESYTPEQRARWLQEWKDQMGKVNSKKSIREFKLQKDDISLLCNAILSNKRYYTFAGCYGR